jgi:hypothetical protein
MMIQLYEQTKHSIIYEYRMNKCLEKQNTQQYINHEEEKRK